MTDTTDHLHPYSILTTWSTLYTDLKGTYWEDEDFAAADIAPDIAMAFKLAYEKTDRDEDGVLAVLKATKAWRNSLFISPADVTTMADSFAIHYATFDEPLQEYLDEHFGGLHHTWLNEDGLREIDQAITKPSEIWLVDETGVPGVWVFNHPDHQH